MGRKSKPLFFTKSHHQQWKVCMHLFFFRYLSSSVYLYYIIFKGNASPSSILFTTFFAIIHTSAMYGTLAISSCEVIMCQLFKCNKIFKQIHVPRTVRGTWICFECTFENTGISVELTATLTIACLVPLIFPLVTFIFPCRTLLSKLLSFFHPKSCFLPSYQITFYIFEVILLFLPFIHWGFQAWIFGNSVEIWNKGLKRLVQASKNVKTTKRFYQREQLRVIRYYREYQVYTCIINGFSQNYFLPVLQIVGSCLIIVGLYTTIMFHGNLPMLVYSFTVVFTAVETIFCCAFLDVASKGLIKMFVNIEKVLLWKCLLFC